MIIIGNKTYKKLEINCLIDYFTNNVRLNMGIPNGKNGCLKDKICMCNHIYEYFVQRKLSIDNILNLYSEEEGYDENHLKFFYNNFHTGEYNEIIYSEEMFDIGKCNELLKRIDCPFVLFKRPRTGIACIIQYIKKNIKPFIFGFSITDEIRRSFYITEKIFQQEERGETCHSKKEELNILRWLHLNNFLDATFCMLQDERDAKLKKSGLVPKKKSIKIIESIYEKLEIVE